MKRKTSIVNYLILAAIVVIFIVDMYYFSWRRYIARDDNAAGAYISLAAVICYIIAINIQDISFAKKLLIGICTVNFLPLLLLNISCSFKEEPLLYLLILTIPLYIAFYMLIALKSKKKAKKTNDTRIYFKFEREE